METSKKPRNVIAAGCAVDTPFGRINLNQNAGLIRFIDKNHGHGPGIFRSEIGDLRCIRISRLNERLNLIPRFRFVLDGVRGVRCGQPIEFVRNDRKGAAPADHEQYETGDNSGETVDTEPGPPFQTNTILQNWNERVPST